MLWASPYAADSATPTGSEDDRIGGGAHGRDSWPARRFPPSNRIRPGLGIEAAMQRRMVVFPGSRLAQSATIPLMSTSNETSVTACTAARPGGVDTDPVDLEQRGAAAERRTSCRCGRRLRERTADSRQRMHQPPPTRRRDRLQRRRRGAGLDLVGATRCKRQPWPSPTPTASAAIAPACDGAGSRGYATSPRIRVPGLG